MSKIIIYSFLYLIGSYTCSAQLALKAEFAFQIKQGDTLFKRIVIQSIDSLSPNYVDIQFQNNGAGIRQVKSKTVLNDHSKIEDKKILIQDLDTTVTKQVSLFKNGKMTNRQLYDAFDELVKEDTLSYNAAGELIHKCSYDYRNNTSLYCDQYTYQKGKLKKWKTFYHWHTISLSGKVIEKKGKRRHYNYMYARDSLCAVKGFYYSTKLRRKIRRKKGIKQSDIQIKKKRIKLPNSSAYKNNVEVLEKIYTNGLLTHVEKRVDDQTRFRISHSYTTDGHIEESTTWHGDKPYKRITYAYKTNKLDRIVEKRFRKNGSLSYHLVSYHDTSGRLIRETQQNKTKKLTELLVFYNGDKISERHFVVGDGTNINKNIFLYETEEIENWLHKANVQQNIKKLLRGSL